MLSFRRHVRQLTALGVVCCLLLLYLRRDVEESGPFGQISAYPTLQMTSDAFSVPDSMFRLQQPPLRSGLGRKLFIGVMSKADLLEGDTGVAMLSTWVKFVTSTNLATVVFFIGNVPSNDYFRLSSLVKKSGATLVRLPVADDQYPPIGKVFSMWTHISQNYLSSGKYEYFFKVHLL